MSSAVSTNTPEIYATTQSRGSALNLLHYVFTLEAPVIRRALNLRSRALVVKITVKVLVNCATSAIKSAARKSEKLEMFAFSALFKR